MAENQGIQKKRKYMTLTGEVLIVFGILIWIIGIVSVIHLEYAVSYMLVTLIGLMLIAVGSFSIIISRRM